MPMGMNEWTEKRALLNHDVLCNQLRNELAAARLDPTHHPLTRLRMWPQREQEYRQFFDAAIDAFSPVHLLGFAFFASWSAEMKCEFGPAFHELFLATSNIKADVASLHDFLNESLLEVNAFLATAAVERTVEQAGAVLARLDTLSVAISALPRTIGEGS